jgi:hypothetical protein
MFGVATGMFKLSAKGTDVFNAVFTRPPVAAAIRFGYTGSADNYALTLADHVTIQTARWNMWDEGQRIHVLGHEHTHLPQQAALGTAAFLARYSLEFPRPNNYKVLSPLDTTPIATLEAAAFCNLSFTMDQMAERVGLECLAVAKAKGYV